MSTARTPWGPALRLAVGTLTVLPTGTVTLDRSTARGAMLLAPLAVLPLGLLTAAVAGVGAALRLPDLVLGLLVVAGLALGTRALHLDGLADTVDGLGTGWDRDRALEVMRRGDVGPMGVVALVVVLGLQAAAVGALADGWPAALGLGLLVCCSRTALSVVCRAGVPAARPTGLGAAVAGTVPHLGLVVEWALVAALLGGAWEVLGGAWWAGVATTGAALATAVLLVAWCTRRLSGVTGDVMGASVEATLTVLLVGAAAAGGWSA